MTLPKVKTALVAKLASIAVHAEEMLSDPHLFMAEGAAALDKTAIGGLLADPDVKALLAHPAMQVFLPRKRSA